MTDPDSPQNPDQSEERLADPFRTNPFSEAPAEPRSRRRRAASRPSGAAAPAAAGEAGTDEAGTGAGDPPVTDAAAGQGAAAVTDEAAGTARPLVPDDSSTADVEAAAELVLNSELPSPGDEEEVSPAALPDADADAVADAADADAVLADAEPAEPPASEPAADEAPSAPSRPARRSARRPAAPPPVITFQAPDLSDLPVRPSEPATGDESAGEPTAAATPDESGEAGDEGDGGGGRSRRRRRGRRGRGRPKDGEEGAENGEDTDEQPSPAPEKPAAEPAASEDTAESSDTSGGTKRRRRRRRRGDSDGDDTPASTDTSSAEDEIKGVSGSTRLEAKRQRRRDNRDQSRRRAPIVTEAEYLARREAVDRVMVVRNAGDRTQIAVLEDNVLVEHYVTRASSSSYAGNVYLGKVQNVLPSMEAAFVDIGKGRNGVLYAGEVNYDASGLEGKPRKIEQALKSGQSVVVQVTKDPIGHKGARLTSQISLPGRYMVYVPEGGSAGISRKLPDTERARLRSILKKITPEDAGVIVRTAAEGASEEELSRDISRLATQWEQIQKKAAKASAPALLSAEPDLVVRVVRDIFNEDFRELVVQGESEWETIQNYVGQVAPDLTPRLRKHIDSEDVFDTHRIDEQLLKALDRKVYLPSGGSLVFDRTEAMTVVDVNTGKFTGKGGNLEETVTRNNLEAAEELVRQLRLRDIGGIIVVDFIDMVLESNRELVLRRLTECLGRDRTKHQVAEVTSLGLVQMTRKRVGQGLLEAYSEPCPTCGGRGVHVELPSPNGTPKTASKPIPRPPTTRPIPLPPEPKSRRRGKDDADEVESAPETADQDAGSAEVGASGTTTEAVETLLEGETVAADASLDAAESGVEPGTVEAGTVEAGGDIGTGTEVETSRPTGDEVEVEAASAETPTDPDVEADSPAARQVAAAEASAELEPTDADAPTDGADAPSDAAGSPAASAGNGSARTGRSRRPARRRASRPTPTPTGPASDGPEQETDDPLPNLS